MLGLVFRPWRHISPSPLLEYVDTSPVSGMVSEGADDRADSAASPSLVKAASRPLGGDEPN